MAIDPNYPWGKETTIAEIEARIAWEYEQSREPLYEQLMEKLMSAFAENNRRRKRR